MTSDTRWTDALRVSDARGLADIAVHATEEVTSVVEGVHQSVHGTLGLRGVDDPGRTGGLTGWIYGGIRGVTRLTGAGLGASLGLAELIADRAGYAQGSSARRDVWVGALNGVLGDRLVARNNPLAVPMSLRHGGQAIDERAAETVPKPSGRILLLIHGLCMSDHCWRSSEPTRGDMGETLARRLGHTPVYLRYNTGRAIAANGLELAKQLERLLARWPVPVESLTVVGHSMGGLLARSAAHQARQRGHRWPGHLKNLVFLGTPHHGAPLERAGAWVEQVLVGTPYTRPFRTLSSLRSAGIKDLRHGNVLPTPGTPEGTVSGDEPSPRQDRRAPCPLPDGVNAFAIAATRTAANDQPKAVRLECLDGDGLVPVASALGRHHRPGHHLGLGRANRVVIHDTHHMGLLDSAEVERQLVAWLGEY